MQISPQFASHLVSCLRQRVRLDRGAALIEYVMVVGLIAIVALIAVSTFGTTVGGMHQEIADTMVSLGD